MQTRTLKISHAVWQSLELFAPETGVHGEIRKGYDADELWERVSGGRFVTIVSISREGYAALAKEPKYTEPKPNQGPARLALILPRVGNREIK